jgi:hypothetical protein
MTKQIQGNDTINSILDTVSLISDSHFSYSLGLGYNACMKPLNLLESFAQGLIEGAFSRVFQTESRTETKKVLTGASTAVARRWLLQLGTEQVRLGEPVINIGRALDNDVILNDPTVSRYHAQFRWRQGRYHVCPPTPPNDLTRQQANGTDKGPYSSPWTTVNQQPVIQQSLSSGDVVALGATTLRVVVEQAQD